MDYSGHEKTYHPEPTRRRVTPAPEPMSLNRTSMRVNG